MADHYEALGVPRDADEQAIKRAFRKAAKDAHPDRKDGSHERMSAINQAYATLSDPAKRARYDSTGRAGRRRQDRRAARAGFPRNRIQHCARQSAARRRYRRQH